MPVTTVREKPVITQHRSVYSHFLDVVRAIPESVALLSPGKSDLTFEALSEQVSLVRRHLAGLGLGTKSRIGLLINSRDAFASTYLGIVSCATAVPLNPAMTLAELEFCVDDFELSALIVDELSEQVNELTRRKSLPSLLIRPDSHQCGVIHLEDGWSGPGPEPEMPGLDDFVALTHTSGTTGRPKIVPRTNRNGLTALTLEWKTTGMAAGDRALNVLPLFNSQGLLGDLQPVLLARASVALAEFDPRIFLDLVEKYQPSFFTLVPTMFQAVLESGSSARFEAPESLRFVRSSSAALTPQLKRSIEEVFSVPVIHAYGSSEAGGVAMTGLTPESSRQGSVGRPLHEGVSIMNGSGNAVPIGERGEVWITGPNVMPGYLDDDAANAEVFHNGWYRSGDEGYIDEGGFLYLTGRLRETINRGGELISPQQVDEVLESHECVAQAAAFGVAHDKLGEEIWAALVAKDGCEPDMAEIRSFAAQRLTFSRVPKRLFLVDELPVNLSGKIVRSELAHRFASEPPETTST